MRQVTWNLQISTFLNCLCVQILVDEPNIVAPIKKKID